MHHKLSDTFNSFLLLFALYLFSLSQALTNFSGTYDYSFSQIFHIFIETRIFNESFVIANLFPFIYYLVSKQKYSKFHSFLFSCLCFLCCFAMNLFFELQLNDTFNNLSMKQQLNFVFERYFFQMFVSSFTFFCYHFLCFHKFSKEK